MHMDQSLSAFFEELEKLGVSKGGSTFMQARKGRRPIRAHKLLEKDMEFSNPPVGGDDGGGSAGTEHEYGGGMEEKLGGFKLPTPPTKKEAISGAVSARPWISSAVKGAVPAALSANFLIPATSTRALKHKSRIVAGVGALGAGAGIVDRALRRWAKRHPRSSVAKELEKQGAYTMRKVAAMAADLRRNGLGGVKRPPFVTEGSKRFAFNQLKNANRPGYFTTQTQQKHLSRPGPSIQQIAATPGG